MPYDTKSVTTSERAYQVLRFIYQSEEGSYSTEIAEELEMNQSLVSNIIQNLTDLGILRKGKRTRAQYYVINMSGAPVAFSKIWSDQLSLSESADSLKDLLESIISKIKEKEKNLNLNEGQELVFRAVRTRLETDKSEYESDLSIFVQYYVKNYLDSFEESTVQKMLFEDFKSSLYRDYGNIPSFSGLGSLKSAMNIISEESISESQVFADAKLDLLQKLLDIPHIEITASDTGIAVKCNDCEENFKEKSVEDDYTVLECGCDDRVQKVPKNIINRIPALKEF